MARVRASAILQGIFCLLLLCNIVEHGQDTDLVFNLDQFIKCDREAALTCYDG